MPYIDSQVPEILFQQLSRLIERELGLAFHGTKARELLAALPKMARSLGMERGIDCVNWLLAGNWTPSKTALCANHLTIGETYFFREPRAFALVSEYARDKVRALASGDKSLRIWSAGCCTGEEPYSIAIALQQVLPRLRAQEISIFATDISQSYLDSARAGVFRQWSFRNLDSSIIKTYFCETGDGRLAIRPDIKQLVQFRQLNLVDALPQDLQSLDIVFCRNVLMYFSEAQAARVIQGMRAALKDGGWLIVSPCEASANMFTGFSATYYPDAVYFQKKSEASRFSAVSFAPDNHEQPAPRTRSSVSSAAVPAMVSVRLRPRSADRINADTSDHHPLPAQFHFNRALRAIEAGDQAGAIQHLRRLLYLSPESVLGHYWIGVAYLEQNRQHDAERAFEVARQLLSGLQDDDPIPDSDGWSAAYLREAMLLASGKAAA